MPGQQYVEPIIFFSCISIYSFITIDSQVIYQFVSESHKYTSNRSVIYCNHALDSSITSAQDQSVANDVSRWTKLASTLKAIANMISVLVLTAWSEKIGRRNALLFPVTGILISCSLLTINVYFRISLILNVIASVTYGASGGLTTLMNVGTSHLCDTVEKEKRGMRYSALEICAAVGGGSVEIGVGFWINRHGFFPSCVFITCSAFVALVFTIFLRSEGTTAETRDLEPLVPDKLLQSPSENKISKVEEQEKIQKSSIMSQLREVVRIYTSNGIKCDICSVNGIECLHCDVRAKSRVWRLWLYLVAYVIYMASVDGYELFMTMFLVTAPFCFTPDLVGVRAGLDAAVMLCSPVVMVLYRFLNLGNQTILLVSIFARILTSVVLFLATNAALVFFGTALGAFSNYTTPYIRLQISNLVSPTEQGPALALVPSVAELVNIAMPTFILTIYPLTLYIRHSFIWAVLGLLYSVAFLLMTIMWLADKIQEILRSK